MLQAEAPPQPTSKRTNADTVSHLIQVAVIGMGLVLLEVLIVWLIDSQRPASLNLRFNIYALLSAASFVSNLVAFILLARIKLRTDVLLWFSVFLLSLTSWAGAETMLRLSATPAGAAFWAPFTTMGSVVMPIALYMFALTYTDAKRSLSPFVFPLLIGVSVMFLFTDAHSSLLSVYSANTMKMTDWGFATETGPAYFTISLWLILLSAASLLLLVRFRRRTIEPRLRHQTRLFVIAIAIPLVVGGITDGVLPVFNVDLLPPMSVTLLTIMGIIISYGIRKHHFFSFTPGLIAGEILSTMNEAVIGITPDLVLSYANVGTERLLGLSAKKLINRRLQDLLAETWTPDELQHKVFDHLAHQTLYTLDAVKFVTTSGGTVTTKLSITKVVGEDQPYGYLLVLTDISALAQTQTLIEQKVVERTHQLHEEQAKLWASIESLALGFVLADATGAIIVQNKALATIFNLAAPATSIGQLQEHLTNTDLAAKSRQVRDSGRPINVKEANLDAKILQIFIGPVNVDEDGATHAIGTVLVVEDITEAKVMERSKDEFFSIASHELRTPLTSIKGNSSMILDFYKDILKDDQLREMVEDMHTSSDRLIEIVNDFLDLSRLEQGKISFAYAPVAVEKVIESVVFEMKGVLDEKKLYLHLDKVMMNSLPPVWADENRLKQVVYNLVGNATKFTESGGISISASLDPTKTFIKVAISDTGRGMTAESQKLLFHKFQQASSSLLTRDTTRGTGLGLYISKMIIENMNGQISLDESLEGKGSTFSFSLPIASDQQQAIPPKRVSVTDSSTGLTTTDSMTTA